MGLPSIPESIAQYFNFFRIHLLVFTITPLIFACLFYAANGNAGGNANSTTAIGYQHVEFIDCLFSCYSAMTVTGLVTINISATHPFQQFLLFILMILGDYSVVSLTMVLVRKHFFRSHCEELLKSDQFRRTKTTVLPSNNIFRAFTLNPTKQEKDDEEKPTQGKIFKRGAAISGPINARPVDDYAEERAERDGEPSPLSTTMRRLPDVPETETLENTALSSTSESDPAGQPQESYSSKSGILNNAQNTSQPPTVTSSAEPTPPTGRRYGSLSGKPSGILQHPDRTRDLTTSPVHVPHRLTQDTPRSTERTVHVIPPVTPVHMYNTRQAIRAKTRAMSLGANHQRPSTNGLTLFTTPTMPLPHSRRNSEEAVEVEDAESEVDDVPASLHFPSHRSHHSRRISLFEAPTVQIPTDRHLPSLTSARSAKHTGFGGPPGPIELISELLPATTRANLRHRLGRSETGVTVVHSERNPSFVSGNDYHRLQEKEESWGTSVKTQAAKWLPESLGHLVIGRNSRFFTEELDDEDLEQLGGVEYRALRLLSYLVSAYIIVVILLPFAVTAIYFSQVSFWDAAFVADPGNQTRTVNKYWAVLMQTVASYTGAGLSLVDASLLPFANCYLYLYSIDFAMLAGNHALPMVLRLVIWTGTKIFKTGQTHETLHFLLDHPRRCFLYLFPSHQTWYLALTLVAFTSVEMAGFLILNIGIDFYDALSGWQRFSDALLQSLSVRAAGFGVVPISYMAPALLFLWVVLMYVAIYPVAMAVRATNVYEERSLGVYNEEENDEFNSGLEPTFQGPRREVFSKYLAWHVRKQLAFDIWPLAMAALLICIAERGKILNPETSGYFTIFAIIFECTSAYSTIGLSLGIPGANYSLSGSFSTVSKLIMICVMLRGRHRGLPIAIDRAILLPTEYARIDRQKTIDRRNSSIHVPGVDPREEMQARPFSNVEHHAGGGVTIGESKGHQLLSKSSGDIGQNRFTDSPDPMN